MDKKEISRLVASSTVHQIRSGYTHRFIDITIVEVDGRFFVRPYMFRKNGWYDAFLKTPEGEMKIGNVVVAIEGRVPADLEAINPKVTQAYHDILPGIYAEMRKSYDTKKHEDLTMELVIR